MNNSKLEEKQACNQKENKLVVQITRLEMKNKNMERDY